MVGLSGVRHCRHGSLPTRSCGCSAPGAWFRVLPVPCSLVPSSPVFACQVPRPLKMPASLSHSGRNKKSLHTVPITQISTLFSVGESDAQHLSGPRNFNHLVLGPLATGYWLRGLWPRHSVSIPCPRPLSPFFWRKGGRPRKPKEPIPAVSDLPLATAFREECTACRDYFAAIAVQIALKSPLLKTLRSPQ